MTHKYIYYVFTHALATSMHVHVSVYLYGGITALVYISHDSEFWPYKEFAPRNIIIGNSADGIEGGARSVIIGFNFLLNR
jgi:hypothetical protein